MKYDKKTIEKAIVKLHAPIMKIKINNSIRF
jgi:hypothetical protein